MDKYVIFPAFLLSAFLARLLYFGANLGDALVLLALAGLYGGSYYLNFIKEKPVDHNRLIELEEQVKGMKDKVNSAVLSAGLRR